MRQITQNILKAQFDSAQQFEPLQIVGFEVVLPSLGIINWNFCGMYRRYHLTKRLHKIP